MDKTESGMGWAGLLLFFVVIWILFGSMFNGGFGGGNRCGGNGCGNGCITNCEVEKQEIIDSARTQYLVETTAQQTQNVLGTKIDFYEYNNLRDALNQERTKNVVLENKLYTGEQFNALSRQVEDCCCNFQRRLDGIECNMLKRPNLFGVASTCSGQLIPPIPTPAG